MSGDARRPGKAGPRRSSKANQPFRIVHEDAHMIVLDKKPGVLTVPLPNKQSRNLKEMLDRYLTPQKRAALPVHRIDRYTSGLVIFAKNQRARERLIEQFRARTPERIYLALVRGDVKEDEGTLRHRLELTRDGFRQKVVKTGGTPAVTHYRVLERFHADGGKAALMEVRLQSGLKNQIRVQFRAAGHPLVGDRHYSPKEGKDPILDRQALHAWKLGLVHPATKKKVFYETPLPADMEKAVNTLRKTKT